MYIWHFPSHLNQAIQGALLGRLGGTSFFRMMLRFLLFGMAGGGTNEQLEQLAEREQTGTWSSRDADSPQLCRREKTNPKPETRNRPKVVKK